MISITLSWIRLRPLVNGFNTALQSGTSPTGASLRRSLGSSLQTHSTVATPVSAFVSSVHESPSVFRSTDISKRTTWFEKNTQSLADF